MPVNGDHHADRRDDENEAERQPAIDPPEQLRRGLGRDDAVDREPADGEEQREPRSEIGAAETKDPARENDLRQTRLWTGVAEQPEDDGRRHGPDGRGGEAVPDAKAVVRGEEAGGEKAGVVDERAAPKKRQLARPAVTIAGWDRLDAVRLNLAEDIALGLSSGEIAHRSPSAGITQFRFMRSAHRRPLSPLDRASSRPESILPASRHATAQGEGGPGSCKPRG